MAANETTTRVRARRNCDPLTDSVFLLGICGDTGGMPAATIWRMQKPWDLKERTMEFAVAVFKFCRTLPADEEARDIARQLRRAGSAVGANYRAARRGRSSRDFTSKMSVVIEEADECGFWLELLVRIDLVEGRATKPLAVEANELVAIFTTAQKTSRSHERTART